MNRFVLAFSILVGNQWCLSQTVIDSSFSFNIAKPLFEKGAGPVIAIDAAHNNRHTKTTGLSPLAKILEDDGFDVKENESPFTLNSLSGVDILVIVNPIHDSNVKSWKLPCPSAFTKEEIAVIQRWVTNGGSLFLSADHMPYGGAVQDLASAFQTTWSNSFDWPLKKKWPPAYFSRKHGTLKSSPVTDSSSFTSKINYIGTFTGSAFKSESMTPFLIFNSDYELLLPEEAWKFDKRTTDRYTADGWFQGACMEYGKGKLVFMGESAMFTAQLRGKTRIGMNSSYASENAALALNIFRYLSSDI